MTIVQAASREELLVTRCINRIVFYVGPAGYPIGSRNPIDAVERIGKMGLNALEVQFVRQARMEENKARSIGSKARELGVLLSAHAPYYINFNSVNRATVNKSTEWVLKAARIGDMMGAWVIVIHAASYSGKSKKTATKAVARGLKKCGRIMEDEGL
ncbi:MAG: TIM barrel protein, partial [Methanomassiliicoccales archaeon]|nr:TIM barrel protein [Methanomassiliicoccales archaeon]